MKDKISRRSLRVAMAVAVLASSCPAGLAASAVAAAERAAPGSIS